MMQSMRNGIEKHFVRQLELLDGWMDGSMHISNAPSTFPFPFPFPFPIFCCALHANWVISFAPYSFVYHHISYYILSFIFLETFSTFQHICVWFFFSFFHSQSSLTCYQNCFCFRYLPHIPWENPTASSPCGRPKGPNDGIGMPGGSGPCGTEWCGCGPP